MWWSASTQTRRQESPKGCQAWGLFSSKGLSKGTLPMWCLLVFTWESQLRHSSDSSAASSNWLAYCALLLLDVTVQTCTHWVSHWTLPCSVLPGNYPEVEGNLIMTSHVRYSMQELIDGAVVMSAHSVYIDKHHLPFFEVTISNFAECWRLTASLAGMSTGTFHGFTGANGILVYFLLVQ